MNLCKINLIGHLGQDPVTKEFHDTKVCNFSIATSERKVDKRSGEVTNPTEWFNIHVWNKQGEACQKRLTKGSQVYVEGKLTTKVYTDRNGRPKTTLEVDASTCIFLDGKAEKPKTPDASSEVYVPPANPPRYSDHQEDIPF